MSLSKLIYLKKNLKDLLNNFFYLSLKNDTLDSNLKNKEDIVKREAILNYQYFAWSSFMCMLLVSNKGKNNFPLS